MLVGLSCTDRQWKSAWSTYNFHCLPSSVTCPVLISSVIAHLSAPTFQQPLCSRQKTKRVGTLKVFRFQSCSTSTASRKSIPSARLCGRGWHGALRRLSLHRLPGDPPRPQAAVGVRVVRRVHALFHFGPVQAARRCVHATINAAPTFRDKASEVLFVCCFHCLARHYFIFTGHAATSIVVR
jgi:hypothetical protein